MRSLVPAAVCFLQAAAVLMIVVAVAIPIPPATVPAEDPAAVRKRIEADLIERMKEARRPPAGYLAGKDGVYRIGDFGRVYMTVGSASVERPWAYDVACDDAFVHGLARTFEEALEAVMNPRKVFPDALPKP